MAKDPLVIDENKGQGNQQQAEIDAVISNINSGLENMSTAELARAMQLLQSHRGEVNDAGRAFTKLATFVQGELDKFADNKKSYNDQEYPDVETLNNIVAEGQNTPEAIARQKAVQSKISQNIQQKSANDELLDLKSEDAPNLEANFKTVDKMLEGYDPLAKNAKGQLVNPQMQTIASYFDHLDFNASSPDGHQSKEELLKDIMELASLQAQSELALLNFAKVDDDKKQKLLKDTFASHADAIVLKMIQAQMLADFQTANQDLIGKQNLTDAEKEELAKRAKEFEAKCAAATKGYIERDYSKGNAKLSNVVATSGVIESSLKLVERNTQIAKKTGFAKLKENALKFDAKMKAKHPKIYSATQKAMISGAVGFTTGGAGLIALAAYRSGEVIYKSYKSYKASGTDGNYGKYLLNNPKEILAIGSSVALTAVSAYFGVNDLMEHGGNAAGVLGKTLFSDGAQQEIGNRVTKAAIRGSISVTSGLSNAMIDVRAALASKDAAERKQLLKNAAKTAGLSIAAGAGGLIAAEYAGDGINWLKGKLGFGAPKVDANQVDGVTDAAVKVNSTNIANTDLLKLNAAEMDDRLFKLGIKPDVYKDMSDVEKTMLLRQRTTELGDLAKEDPATGKTSERTSVEEQAPSESQLKNMLKRNSERHPDVDLNKVYDQFKAAGIKNPEEAFYKLEQSRLLAPNDKIMTVDGTNIRQTMERALKGEALTAADLKIIGTASANVDNTGHYLNDVRSQGGTGYSYRPNGVETQNEQISEHKTGANINIKAEGVVAGAETNAVTSDKTVTSANIVTGDNLVADTNVVTDGKTVTGANIVTGDNLAAETNVVTDGKTVTGDNLVADTNANPEPAVTSVSYDDATLLKHSVAQQQANSAEMSYQKALLLRKSALNELNGVKNLMPTDPARITAELKYAETLKMETTQQMEFAKAKLAADKILPKAELENSQQLLANRIANEQRMMAIRDELKSLGVTKTSMPETTGSFGKDRSAINEYHSSIKNISNNPEVLQLLKERQAIYEQMKEEGARPLLEKRVADAEKNMNFLSKRELYAAIESKESTQNATPEITEVANGSSKQNATTEIAEVANGSSNYNRETLSRIGTKMTLFKAKIDKGIVPPATSILADRKVDMALDKLAAQGITGDQALAEISKNSGVSYDAERNVMIYNGKVLIDPLNNQVDGSRNVIYDEGSPSLERRGFGKNSSQSDINKGSSLTNRGGRN